MCTAVRDTQSREPLLSTSLSPGHHRRKLEQEEDDEDIVSPAQDSIISCTTRSQSEFTSYTDSYTQNTSDRATSAPSYTDTEYEKESVANNHHDDDYDLSQTPAPLDPNWTMSSGSSFSDYTDSSVTLPSLHENGDMEERDASNMLLPTNTVSKLSSANVGSAPPSSGGFMGKLKGFAVTFVDKILVDDRNGVSTTDTEAGSQTASTNPPTSFKQGIGSMFSRKSSASSIPRPPPREPVHAHKVPPKPIDTSTLLGMVKQYEVDKKNDGCLQPEQNIPQLIRVEEGAILFRRDSPGARSARSGKIGHGFRRQKVNADDSSAFSAYSQISHVSSMGIVSLEEEMELDSKPSGARPSPLGGRDKDESDVTTRPAGENLSDTLDKAPLNSCYFRDGKRQIDFVLAYRLDCSGGQAESKRRIYESNLRERGLELEHESAEHSSDNNTYFVKVHCPFDVLCDGAEFMNLKMPFKEEERTHSSWLDHLVPTCVRSSFASPLDPLPQVYTTTFDKNKLHKIKFIKIKTYLDLRGMEHYYVGGSDHETLFNSSQRIQIVSGILLRTPHTPPDERVKIGIQRLLDTDVYISAFPLHDSTLVEPEGEDDLDPEPRPESDRQKLYRGWGRFAMWKNAQPLDHIRRYFGEKVSLYFCWLGFYTTWLIVPSIVGVVCFLYGIITYNQNEIADGICANKKDFLMCPRCDSCHFEILDCKGVRVSHLFDNNFTVAFSVFMSIWARLFLEFWKREQSSKAFEWDTLGFEGQDEPPRPQYEQKATETEVNPVTMKTEPSIPNTARYPRLASAFMVSLFMISLVIAAVIGVIVYRLAIRGILAKTSLSDDIAVSSVIVSGAGALANFLFILFMSTLYYKLAHFLTDWEMHRTQTEYEDALSFKMYMFQFVNFYSSIFYIAFVQGRFNGTPPNYNRLLGYRQEECGSYGCLLDLCIQLFVIMVGKQTIGNFLELGVPRLKVWLKSKSGDDDMNNFPNWDQEFQLEPWPEDGLFDEYLEMVIQYGFITIFVACFPLAPVFALVNNIIEIRLDGNKILCSTRRCVPDRAEDIGIWYDILERVSTLAVICNACIIAFTSEFIPRLVYMYTINSDLTNYANYTLGTCDIDLLNLTKTVLDSRIAIEMDNATHCRYRMHFSTDPANPAIWMQVTAARLGFIIVFEHFVFFITGLVDFMIPDIPDHVQTAIEREKYLGKEALRAREASPLPSERNNSLGKSQLSSLPEELTSEQNVPSSLSYSDVPPGERVDSRLSNTPASDSDTFHQINSLPSHLPSYNPSETNLQPARASSVTSRQATKHSALHSRSSAQSDYQNMVTSDNISALVQDSTGTGFNRISSDRNSRDNFELSEISRNSRASGNHNV